MSLLLALLLTATSHAQVKAIIGQVHKTVTTAGTPLAVSSSTLLVRQACFQCSGANTGTTCFVGNSAANAVAAKGIVLAKPTATVVQPAFCLGSTQHGAGPAIDLAAIFVDVATSNDEVNVIYTE